MGRGALLQKMGVCGCPHLSTTESTGSMWRSELMVAVDPSIRIAIPGFSRYLRFDPFVKKVSKFTKTTMPSTR